MPFSSRIGCVSRQQHGKAAGFVMHVRTISLAPRDQVHARARARVHHLRNLHSDFLRQGYYRSSTADAHMQRRGLAFHRCGVLLCREMHRLLHRR